MKIKNALFYVISCIIIIVLAIILISIMVRKDKIARDSKTSTTTTEIMTQDTTVTTTTTKTTKKAVKTTKKTTTTKKKTNTNSTGFDIKASKNEIIQYAHNEVLKKWGEEHWEAFYNIVSHESGWNPNNVNKKSGACGLFQFVPCSKGGSAYKHDYKVQIQKGIQYIEYRYGTPNKAWAFWQKHHWY